LVWSSFFDGGGTWRTRVLLTLQFLVGDALFHKIVLLVDFVVLGVDIFNNGVKFLKLLQIFNEQIAIGLIKSGGQSTESKSCEAQSLLILLLQLVENVVENQLLLEYVVTYLLFSSEQCNQLQDHVDYLVVVEHQNMVSDHIDQLIYSLGCANLLQNEIVE